MPLVKPSQIHRTEPLIFVKRANLDIVVVDPDPPVWISHGDIQSEIVMQVVVRGCEIELRESGVGGVKLKEIWTEDEPQEETGNGDENEESDDDLTDQIEDTAADAVAEAAKTAAAGVAAAAGAVVGFGRGRNGRAVVGSVEVGVFGSHC